MDRVDMGSNLGRDKVLCSTTTQVVKEVARIPVWVKLTPATADIVEEATATFLGGADAVVTSNTFPSLPPIDPDTLDFEVNVESLVSSGGLGGPAILMQSLAKVAQLAGAFPDREICGVGGISGWADALSYFLLGSGTVQVATAAMLDHAIGPNVIRALTEGMTEFLDRHAERGWRSLADFRGYRRDAVVAHGRIPRPGTSALDRGETAGVGAGIGSR
jgi:dihydropyrimidine dehydrogenase (NAD+) subunit PreA